MCLFGRTLANKKYKANKKNGGIIPAVNDERALYVEIECGNCIECRKAKARDLQVRLMEDCKIHKNGKFVTLTFNNESIAELSKLTENLEGYEKDNKIATIAVRRFLENIRSKTGKSVRHLLVTELGHNGTENIHLHGVIWIDDVKLVREKWKYGYSWIGYEKNGWLENYVNGQTANYISKYVTKSDPIHKYYKSKILCSKGIGLSYVTSMNKLRHTWNGKKTVTTYKTENGTVLPLPKYYRKKLFNDDEREKLWMQSLDENKKFIMGVEFKADDKESIDEGLKYARKENYKMGYGGYKVDPEKYLKEIERRNQLNEKRIKEAYKKQINEPMEEAPF